MYIRVNFCRLPRNVLGDSEILNSEKALVRIDLRKETNPARTFLHELLHIKYPQLSESAILSKERRMWKRFNQVRRFLLYRELFNRPFFSSDEEEYEITAHEKIFP